ALTTREIDRLFDVVRRVTANGAGVVYISHRLQELSRIGDRVTVLRDGRHTGTFALADVSIDQLVCLMANRDVRDHFPRRRAVPGDELLRLEHVSAVSGVDDVSLTVRRGEDGRAARPPGAGHSAVARVPPGPGRPATR